MISANYYADDADTYILSNGEFGDFESIECKLYDETVTYSKGFRQIPLNPTTAHLYKNLFNGPSTSDTNADQNFTDLRFTNDILVANALYTASAIGKIGLIYSGDFAIAGRIIERPHFEIWTGVNEDKVMHTGRLVTKISTFDYKWQRPIAEEIIINKNGRIQDRETGLTSYAAENPTRLAVGELECLRAIKDFRLSAFGVSNASFRHLAESLAA